MVRSLGMAQGKEPLKTSLSQEVYGKLLGKLFDNSLVPGNILNRREVANELGVSVAPVLEALLQLELEGFVESIPRKGTIVKPIRQEDVFGQLIVREAIECEAVRFYHGAIIGEHRDELLGIAEELEKSDLEAIEHWKKEIEFHRALVELAGCPVLEREFLRTMRLGVFYSMNRLLPTDDRLHRESHIELIDRLNIEDPDEAERIMRDHLRSGKRHLFP